MHALANPARFLRFARPATTWLLLVGLALAAFTGGYAFFRRVQTGFGDLV